MIHIINKFRGRRNSGTAGSRDRNRTGFSPLLGSAFLCGFLFHMVAPDGLSFQMTNWPLRSSLTSHQARVPQERARVFGSGSRKPPGLLAAQIVYVACPALNELLRPRK